MDHEDNAMPYDLEPVHEESARREKLAQLPVFTGWSQSTTDIQTMITSKISGLKKQE